MRALHLATTYPLHPGDSNAAFVESIAEGLAARGHDIDMVVPWHPRLQLQRPGRAVRLHAFRYSPSRRWHPWGYAQALTADRALRRDAYAAAGPAAVSSLFALRRLLRRQSYDVVHAHWLLPNAPIAAAAVGRHGPPLVISCHGSGVYLAERHGWARRAARWALARATALTACSADLAMRAGAMGVGPLPQRVPYGVDTAAFAPLSPADRQQARARLGARYGIGVDEPWVLAVGRLVYKKGFDVLVRAMGLVAAQVPGARCVIVGEGPLRAQLEALAGECGAAANVRLVGAQSHREMALHYASADVITVPSVIDAEGNVDGLPNTLMEALSSGTPVVASRVAGIPDVVRDGDNGLLCQPGEIEPLAGALLALLRDRGRAARIGDAARRDAVDNLGWEHVAARFEAIYRSMCEGRS